MIFGSLFAMIHGAALPAMIIVFGDMTDLFVDSGKFQLLVDSISGFLPNLTLTTEQVYDNPYVLK